MEVVNIPIEKLKISKYNIRSVETDLSELIVSVKNDGVLQPLIVRKTEDGTYEVIAGGRRLQAAKEAGLKEVPCRVVDVTDEEAILISLIENIQRNNLCDEEIAQAYYKLKEIAPKWTVKKFAERIGKSETWVRNILQAYEFAKKYDLRIKSRPSDEDVHEGIVSTTKVLEISKMLKDVEGREGEMDRLVKTAVRLPTEKAKELIEAYKQHKDVDIAIDQVLHFEPATTKTRREKRAKTKRPSMITISDFNSIFTYIHYLVDLLKSRRDGLRNYVEKVKIKPGLITIFFSGYEDCIPKDFSITLRHEYTGSGKDMVVATVREDEREIFETLKKEISSQEKLYSLIKSKECEVKEEVSVENFVKPKPMKKRTWSLRITDRAKLLDIYYKISDKDKRTVWSELMNSPFGSLSENEVLAILRNRGLSKEMAKALLEEIREEWYLEGWIEVSEV